MTERDLYDVLLHFSRLSLDFFLDHVRINSSPEPRAWGDIRESWQDQILLGKRSMFEALAFPEIEYSGNWNFIDILPRGHDKSSLEGRLATWLLLASRRQIRGYILASDKDQGALILQAIDSERHLNPWYADHITVHKNEVRGPAGFVEVLPADPSGAYGLRGNFYILDELTNWGRPVARECYTAVVSGFEKVQPRIVGILTNAGYRGSWQEPVCRDLLESPYWNTYVAPGHQASWMPKEKIEELRKQLPPVESRRVFDNEWVSLAEALDYLSEDDAKQCIDETLTYRLLPERKVGNYVVSIDYGPKRDRTVVAVGHQLQGGTVVIDRMDVRQGRDFADGEVDFDDLNELLDNIRIKFKPVCWVVDPYQMIQTMQRLKKLRQNVVPFVSRGGKAQVEIAQQLRSHVLNRKVFWYPGCGRVDGDDTLEKEISELTVKKMSYGFRLDHSSHGHDDRAVAIGQLILHAADHPWVPKFSEGEALVEVSRVKYGLG